MFHRVLFSICCLASGHLWASTLYNNLGPGDTFFRGYFGSGDSLMATTFTTTGAGPLSTILLPITGPSVVTLALYSNSAGEPGSRLESWTANAPPPGDNPPPITLTSVQKTVLSSGTQYWFVITQQAFQISWWTSFPGTSTPENDGFWAGNSINSLSQIPSVRMNMVAIQLNSFEEATRTPEPASAVLLLVGLTWCCLSRRKR
jgi:hypothetical protein